MKRETKGKVILTICTLVGSYLISAFLALYKVLLSFPILLIVIIATYSFCDRFIYGLFRSRQHQYGYYTVQFLALYLYCAIQTSSYIATSNIHEAAVHYLGGRVFGLLFVLYLVHYIYYKFRKPRIDDYIKS